MIGLTHATTLKYNGFVIFGDCSFLAESVTPTLLARTDHAKLPLQAPGSSICRLQPTPPQTNSKVYPTTDSTSQAKILPRSLSQCGQNELLPPQRSSSRLEQKKFDKQKCKHPTRTKTQVDVQPKSLTPTTKPTHTQKPIILLRHSLTHSLPQHIHQRPQLL